jgi:two-component system OmpR family response regulator
MPESGTETTEEPGGFRVLIVDDNRDAADTLAVLARVWGYDVRAAYDGEAGWEAARAFRPHCLLSDIGLPRLDGFALARRLRKQPELRDTKLVAITAYAAPVYDEMAKEAGFDYFFAKPADLEVLGRLLKMLQEAVKLAQRTEALAQQNVELAKETKELLTEVREEIKEVKHELREVREEIREVKEAQAKDGGGPT